MTKISNRIRKKNLTLKGFVEEDYYFDEFNHIVFTAIYHKKRGYCCKKSCKHCPWGHKYMDIATLSPS